MNIKNPCSEIPRPSQIDDFYNEIRKWEHRIKITEAAQAGEIIEMRLKGNPFALWHNNFAPDWKWDEWDYRVMEFPIAFGNNPLKLNINQVGEKDGWRLLTAEEIEANSDNPQDRDELESYARVGTSRMHGGHPKGWGKYDNPLKGASIQSTYRTKMPVGYYLPKAKGCNPDKLTEKQVGVKQGWRLLEREEYAVYLEGKRIATKDIQMWDMSNWLNGLAVCADVPTRTYRTRKPAGYFLPTKTVSGIDLFGGGFVIKAKIQFMAKGHNPDWLTEEQVETNLGWRLLEKEEMPVSKEGDGLIDGLESWTVSNKTWGGPRYGADEKCTYRTRKPVGYYLPKIESDEEVMEGLCQETWGGPLWPDLKTFATKLLQHERSKK